MPAWLSRPPSNKPGRAGADDDDLGAHALSPAAAARVRRLCVQRRRGLSRAQWTDATTACTIRTCSPSPVCPPTRCTARSNAASGDRLAALGVDCRAQQPPPLADPGPSACDALSNSVHPARPRRGHDRRAGVAAARSVPADGAGSGAARVPLQARHRRQRVHRAAGAHRATAGRHARAACARAAAARDGVARRCDRCRRPRGRAAEGRIPRHAGLARAGHRRGAVRICWSRWSAPPRRAEPQRAARGSRAAMHLERYRALVDRSFRTQPSLAALARSWASRRPSSIACAASSPGAARWRCCMRA